MNLSDILIDPDSNSPIQINWDKETIDNLNLNLYYGKIKEGIPIILPRSNDQIKNSTQLHENLGTEFNYIDHYQKDAKVFDYHQKSDDVTENERTRLNQKITTLINKKSKLILDVGCGNGWLSKMVQNDKNAIVSLDIALDNVKKSLLNEPHPNHSGIVADVFHLPFKKNSFDSIVASEVIEHVYDPKKFIECLFQILKPDGELIITTPFDEKIPLYLCVHCNKSTPKNAHLHSFNDSNIKEIISPEIKNWRYEKITNKYFLKARIYWLLRKTPFAVWSGIDKIANKIFKKPTRLVITIKK